MNLGLRPLNFSFINAAPVLLKRDLLYFDQIHLCSYNDSDFILDGIKIVNPEQYDSIQRDFEYLKSKGLLCTFNLSEMLSWTINNFGVLDGTINKTDFQDIMKLIESFLQIKEPSYIKFNKGISQKKSKSLANKYLNSINKIENEVTRVSSFFLNRFAERDSAFPLLQNDNLIGVDPFHKSKVLEVVLEKLPIPDENIEWEKIVEFRSDSNSHRKFGALRVWMQDITRNDYNKKEIEERIDYLMYEYESHLKLHKLKFRHGKLRILVSTTLEILENIIKLKLGTISNTMFSLREKKI